MRLAWVFAGVAVLAGLAGTAMWLGERAAIRVPDAPEAIAPTALWASAFVDLEGRARSLGELQGSLLVVNFWATWCAPCREEMPAFSRVHARWAARGVRFVGLSAETPEVVRRFSGQVPVSYPLWTGEAAEALSRRLGNRIGVLPHTAIIAPDGAVLESRIGPYTESQLEERLAAFSANRR